MTAISSIPPKKFSRNEMINIPKNISLSKAAYLLYKEKIISSPFVFKVAVVFFGGQKGIQAGDYVFKEAKTVWTVAYRMVNGDHGLPKIKVTIREGETVADIADIFNSKIPNFNTPYFLKISSAHEGYLFPDTYTFYSNVSAEEVFNTLRKNFDKKMKSLMLGASLSGRKLHEIIIMASILEKEANTYEDRSIISGILWKRLDENIPLQVDVTFHYFLSRKDTFISLEDLKIDSPYNTYKYRGLPRGPISNPGLDSIKAAIYPKSSPHYFYLSDKKGNMHYAISHDEHVENKRKYLD